MDKRYRDYMDKEHRGKTYLAGTWALGLGSIANGGMSISYGLEHISQRETLRNKKYELINPDDLNSDTFELVESQLDTIVGKYDSINIDMGFGATSIFLGCYIINKHC